MTLDCPAPDCKLEGRVGRLEHRVKGHHTILHGPDDEPSRSLVFMVTETRKDVASVKKILWFIAAMICAAVVTAILKSSGIGP